MVVLKVGPVSTSIVDVGIRTNLYSYLTGKPTFMTTGSVARGLHVVDIPSSARRCLLMWFSSTIDLHSGRKRSVNRRAISMLLSSSSNLTSQRLKDSRSDSPSSQRPSIHRRRDVMSSLVARYADFHFRSSGHLWGSESQSCQKFTVTMHSPSRLQRCSSSMVIGGGSDAARRTLHRTLDVPGSCCNVLQINPWSC